MINSNNTFSYKEVIEYLQLVNERTWQSVLKENTKLFINENINCFNHSVFSKDAFIETKGSWLFLISVLSFL